MSDTTATPPLPELQQAQFDAAELERLLRDIGACAQITEIIPKYAATGHVPENAAVTLDDGRRLLLDGGARAVQFRYRFQDADWWDTVMALPGGQFRLVRIQHFTSIPPHEPTFETTPQPRVDCPRGLSPRFAASRSCGRKKISAPLNPLR